jgi:hypothetical protein
MAVDRYESLGGGGSGGGAGSGGAGSDGAEPTFRSMPSYGGCPAADPLRPLDSAMRPMPDAAETAKDRNASAAKSSWLGAAEPDFAAEEAPSGFEPLYEALQASA